MAKTRAYISSPSAEKYNLPANKKQKIRCLVWERQKRVLAVTESPEAAVTVYKQDIDVKGGLLKELLIDRDNELTHILDHVLDPCLKKVPSNIQSSRKIAKYIRKKHGLPKNDAKNYADVIRQIRLFEATDKWAEDIEPIHVGNDPQDDLVFHENLFTYQREAISTMVHNDQNILLNDPMGAGKTVESIYTMINLDEWPVLVVCPSSVKSNWKHEILHWVPNSEGNISVVDGQSGPYEAKKWTIINWAILYHRYQGLRKIGWGGIIGDEFHYAKNREAKRSQSMMSICSNNKQARVLGLTGTPVMNRPSEIYYQLKILGHKLGDMDFYDFCRRFCGGFNAPYGFETDYLPNARLNDLAEAISNTLIKRERREILDDLPPLRRGWYHVDVEKDSMMKFSEEFSEIREKYHELREKSKTEHIMSKIQNMRMLSAYGKAPAVGEIAAETITEDNQVLIFCDFKDPLDVVEDKLDNKDFRIERITGDTTDDKYEISERFNDRDQDTRLILATGAAETGINLTGADEVWFLSLNWNPMSHRQREDRALRIGREESVLVRYFESDLAIDDLIASSLHDKLDAVEEVIGTADEDHFTEDRKEKESVLEIAEKLVNWG